MSTTEPPSEQELEEAEWLRLGRMKDMESAIERIRTLRATVAKLEQERDALKDTYLNVADERSQLRATVAKLEAVNIQNAQHYFAATEALRTSEAEVATLRDAVNVFMRDNRLAPMPTELNGLRAQLAERDEQIAALRHWLSPQRIGDPATYLANVKQALTNTAQAAVAHDERVRAGERERIRDEIRRVVEPNKQMIRGYYMVGLHDVLSAIAALSTARKEET